LLDVVCRSFTILSETLSNGLITNYTYDPKTTLLTNIDTILDSNLMIQKNLLPEKHQKTLQKEFYIYDALGNVISHYDNVNNVSENYKYDGLNRLIESNALNLKYDSLGNIIYKSDVGAYKYGFGPHGVTSITGTLPSTFNYNANGDQIQGTLNGVTRTIAYTSYSKPLSIITPKTNVTFYYDANRQKFARVDSTELSKDKLHNWHESENSTIVTTYYLDNYELVFSGDSIQQKSYIGPHTIHIKTIDKNTSVHLIDLLYNNIGSVTDITDEIATILQHFTYTPFGEQDTSKSTGCTQGFTSHEHIAGTNLIHMGGRLYDPVIGRFLSADPYVQTDNLQSLNRYSYCINNPVSLIDPTGFGFWSSLFNSVSNFFADIWHGIRDLLKSPYVSLALGIAIGAVTIGFGWAMAASCLSGYNGVVTLAHGGNINNAFLSAGLTFATASIWYGTGNILSSIKNSTNYWIVKTLTHGTIGGGLRAALGGSFEEGFLAASVSAALPIDSIGSANSSRIVVVAERTLAAGVVGGTVAAITGGNFINGAETAAFAELFNDALHELKTITVDEGQRVVSIASKWENTKYARAETKHAGPNPKFGVAGDCSGITNAVYKEAGFHYPYHTANRFAETLGAGHFVKVEDPQPGDVVSWYGKNHHLAIYAGDGQMWTTFTNHNNREFGLGRVNTYFKDQSKPDYYFRYIK
jgi:RHS repeat-associated protein